MANVSNTQIKAYVDNKEIEPTTIQYYERRSKKFHLPTCPNLPAEKNQILFSSYDEAMAAGYTPCSSCIK